MTTVKVAIFGDSVSTYGGLELSPGADPTLENSYTNSQIGSILSTIQALYLPTYEIINVSRGGMTTDEALTGVQNYVGPGLSNPFGSSVTITQWILDNSPDKIILRYGLADSVLINNSTTTLNNLQTIIDFAVARDIEVILLGVNPAAADGDPANCGYFPGTMTTAKANTAIVINTGIINKAIAQGLKYANPRTISVPLCSLPDGVHPLLNLGVMITNAILTQLRTQVPITEQGIQPTPIWITPSGFLFTASELVSTSTSLLTVGSNVSFSKISGGFPGGINISTTGTIFGVPDPILTPNTNKFVIRAKTPGGISDRTFIIDTQGADDPVWNENTLTNYLNVGIQGEPYAYNNQWVKYQLKASASQAPTGSALKYFIASGDGKLPPGLELSQTGIISGFIRDKLSYDGGESTDGTYDTENYDNYRYDHAGSNPGTPKIYQFRVTATDGVRNTKRLFKIVVTTAEILNYYADSMPDDIAINTATYYIQAPQFINGSDLGVIRANNNQLIPVTAYDGAPLIGTLTYSLITGTNIYTNLPDGLNLDTETGYLWGYVPYQPAYTRSYSFAVRATKTDKFTTSSLISITNTFTLAVKGEVESTIEWVSPSNLGSIDVGKISELKVEAKQIQSNYDIKYQLLSGSLPPGLSLLTDGALSGRVDYGTTGTWSFNIQASDVYELSAIEKAFTLAVNNTSTQYTEIYLRPFLSREKRNSYSTFISNQFTFPPKSIYRPFDNNFGLQSEIKLVLEFGIEQTNLEEYTRALRENFYRKKLYFGDVKKAIAKNTSGTVIYELIYVEVVDNMINSSKQSVSRVMYSNDEIYYPSSVDNMRKNLETTVLNEVRYIDTNEYFLPKFMRTVQPGDYLPPNYFPVVPLCYVKPGEGDKIISRIKLSGFDFKQIDFEIDRIVVQNSLDNSSAKYLLFARQQITDVLETDQYLFGPEGTVILEDEDNNYLKRE